MAGWSVGMQQVRSPQEPDPGAFAGEKELVSDSIREEMANRQALAAEKDQVVYENAGSGTESTGADGAAAAPTVRRSSTGRGESTSMQPQVLFGYNLLQNLRNRPMEDRHVAEIRHVGGFQEVGLFAVFDSHCGTEVADYLKDKLFDNIMSEGGVWSDPAGATRDGYLLTDRQVSCQGQVELPGLGLAVHSSIIQDSNLQLLGNW